MISRVYRGETTVNFYGHRNKGFIVSLALIVVSVGSLLFGGLNLGIDFRGGVAFEVPASGGFTVATAREVLETRDVSDAGAKIQTLSSGAGERVRVQLGDQEPDTVTALRAAFADEAGVGTEEVSVAKVSSSWGRSVTTNAIEALAVFFVIVSLFIAWRFEWRMAVGALASVVHDIVLTVGVYSLLQLEVTPATVTSVLTIMGYSLYDTIVIFDKMAENEGRFASTRASYGDIVNTSMNGVLMRSVNTSISSVLPVVSILIIGAGVLGVTTLSEFAIALFIGMIFGAYSSIFVAAPVVGLLKERTDEFRAGRGQLSLGVDMAHLMNTGAVVGRRSAVRRRVVEAGTEVPAHEPPATVDAILSHPPRPRKKQRR